MAYAFTAASSQHLTTASAAATARPITIACWFYTASTALQSCVGNTDNAFNGVVLRLNMQKVQASTGNLGALNGVTNYTTSAWQHGAGVWSSTNRYVFLNGAQDASDAQSTLGGTPTLVSIGSRFAGATAGIFMDGLIAEVGIWNVALTAAEIASLADGMTCDKVRPDSLVFYAPLVRDLIDYSGGLTITNNNSATVAVHPRVYA